jgi:cytochrome c
MIRTWAGATASFVMFLAAGQAFAQSADAGRGQRVFNQQCRACHTLEKDGANGVGPNLHGVFGRKAGTLAGYSFSEAMTKSGIVWDDTTMAEYCRDPKGKVAGTKMVFNGIKQPAQLDDLVAYLKEATK